MVNMGNVLGLVFANMHDTTINDLTNTRTMGSVPFGGRYRLIDFPLSNMVNSGITEVGVITKSNYQSLLDHLDSGREWDLSRKNGGLHILPPFGHAGSGMYRGRLEALSGVLGYIQHSDAEYVVMSDCDVVANIDLRKVVQEHAERGADITSVYIRGDCSSDQTANQTILHLDEHERVNDVLLRPGICGPCSISLNIFVMSRVFMMEMAKEAASRSLYSFEQDVFQRRVKELKIFGSRFDGYCRQIDSMKSYFAGNMDMLNGEVRGALFPRNRPIYTKVRDEAPARYGIDAAAHHSVIADGCIIDGEVENSVLFRGVRVEKGARVRNSIIMQGTVVGQKSDILYAVTDKEVEIGGYRSLAGSPVYPVFVSKRAVV